MKLYELRKKCKEELIVLYRDKLSEINKLRKEKEALSRTWARYYKDKEWASRPEVKERRRELYKQKHERRKQK